MSKVKIQGHASGTGILTVTAPNTSTDRTITLPDATGTLLSGAGGRRNMIINGAMSIDQRNSGSAISSLGQYSTYTLDRWLYYGSASAKFSFEQNQSSVTPPAGFSNYLGVTSLGANSAGTDETFSISQHIEGFNSSQLSWGTSDAKDVTLSFWVRSSLTGTFSGVLIGGQTYIYTYSISSANTWEHKTITISGSTSGTWNTGNTSGVRVYFTLGYGSGQVGTANTWQANADVAASGSVNVIGTSGATWQVTGVQLELGTAATDFEHRSYGEELALCQRYALMIHNGTTSIDRFGLGSTVNTTQVQMLLQHPVGMRAAPSLTTTGTASDYQVYSATVTACSVVPASAGGSQYNSRINFVVSSGLTAGEVSQCSGANTDAYLLLTSEL